MAQNKPALLTDTDLKSLIREYSNQGNGSLWTEKNRNAQELIDGTGKALKTKHFELANMLINHMQLVCWTGV